MTPFRVLARRRTRPTPVAVGAALIVLGIMLAGCGGEEERPGAGPPAVHREVSEPAGAHGRAAVAVGLDRERARLLYARHCAACHGPEGAGDGPAAAFLFPRPRNFRSGDFRMVSAENRLPTDADLLGVITRGMPGSAMLSWAHLPEEDRRLLVAYVRELVRAGVEDELRAEAAEFGEEVDLEVLAADVARLTQPGALLEVPAVAAATPEAIAHGRELYARTCASCHGETGRGDGVQEQFNDDGSPTRPRDLTLGIFKAEPSPEQLFRRIRLGLPGSPMPADTNLTDEEVAHLVQFVLSLSDEASRERVVMRRRTIRAAAVEDALALDPGADVWDGIEPMYLATTPLWWRDDADADLHVQAAQDGRRLAIRLSWRDPRADAHNVRVQDFEDAAAIELFAGETEPFVGMGAPGEPVEMWFWDADRAPPEGSSGPIATVTDVYPNMVVDQYPLAEQDVLTPETNREGTRLANQPDLFLPPAAAGNQIFPAEGSPVGMELVAAGQGTLTFLPPVSQRVDARGAWEGERWTVVFVRDLEIESGDGLSLQPGRRVSVAFALWDGAAGERDGQKRITIWHDLELASEPVSE